MKKLIPAIAVLLGWASTAWAAVPATLTTLRAIHDLSNDEAAQALPVAFESTVTYIRAYENSLFVQDGGIAIWVKVPLSTTLQPGDRVLIQGKTHADFRPDVHSETITILQHGPLPNPAIVTYDDLNHAKFDSILVTVHGVVRAADQQPSRMSSVIATRLNILADGGDIDAYVDSDDPGVLTEFLDSEVEVTGVAWGRFDGKYQLTGNNLFVSSLSQVKILKSGNTNPWAIPVMPMDQIFSSNHIKDSTQRTGVQGTITYYQPGSALVLQNGSTSLWIMTQTRIPLQIGDLAYATGFPDVHDGFLTLKQAEVQDRHLQGFAAPLPTTWKQLTTNKHIFDLVSIEGKVVSAIREPSQDEYVLIADGYMFSAIYRHPDTFNTLSLPPMRHIEAGTTIRVTGVCVTNTSAPFDQNVPFNILLRNFDDIAVVANPSWLNIRNLLLALGGLVVVVFAAISRQWALERKVRHQTAVMSAQTEAEAELERRRSHILEDINESRPLTEILLQITAMVSSTLGDAPCWCEISDGERLGDCPSEQNNLRIVRASIDARVGPALGTLFAGLNPDTPPVDREISVLYNGARLATLAIETRHLYSDLRRRSEYDLLTDIPNRFALHKRLDFLIQETDPNSIFGLIYIDLDKFKPINDIYGHHVGDLYLQAVAERMNNQLLGGDMVARLGGDEFAVLVALPRGRADLDKILQRLSHCFDAPFVAEGHLIKGAASIGVALYPQDGATKDALLNAADASMYAVKNSKRQSESMLGKE
ncbi:MAG: GGDEF domain-containing protein [Terracidiphilus sp.]